MRLPFQIPTHVCISYCVNKDAAEHRRVEKRRRDRMNSCLSDLDQLIQASYPGAQRQGRVEKAEIIELAIQHINALQAKVEGTLL